MRFLPEMNINKQEKLRERGQPRSLGIKSGTSTKNTNKQESPLKMDTV